MHALTTTVLRGSAVLLVASLDRDTFAADNSTAERWDTRYGKAESFVYGSEPVHFLEEQMPKLAQRRAGPFVLPREKDETPSTLRSRASKSSRWIFPPWA